MKKIDVTLEEFYAFKFKKYGPTSSRSTIPLDDLRLSFLSLSAPKAYFLKLMFYPTPNFYCWAVWLSAIADPSVRWTSSPANKWLIFYFLWIQLSTLTAYNRDYATYHFMDFLVGL